MAQNFLPSVAGIARERDTVIGVEKSGSGGWIALSIASDVGAEFTPENTRHSPINKA
jgi:hypothetical protein